ncbi:DUF1367 family protein [Vibrio metschnikovii]|uniref:DUF1367 family protein n=1 Tax=Vibrio metschnikovii TaxID=28172 RepID=UPI001C30CE25|nr:DUF1367 family protein [Vibrio metschnikovii]EKO3565450.1 DUF1367 family protein [Vibrio metschnikovii]EKO3769030.1 DUF1367 family protein [Vibrio metschnikovii]
MSLSLVRSKTGGLAPLSPEDDEILKRYRVGDVIEFPKLPNKVRNPQFHRKYMALLKLGFDYWEPIGGTLCPSENKLLDNYTGFLSELLGYEDVLEECQKAFTTKLREKRSSYATEKSFLAYRRWVVVEAGFYSVIMLPNGAIRKEPKSISFANMDDHEFNELYRASFNVIWNQIVRPGGYLGSEAEMENVVNQMLGYV